MNEEIFIPRRIKERQQDFIKHLDHINKSFYAFEDKVNITLTVETKFFEVNSGNINYKLPGTRYLEITITNKDFITEDELETILSWVEIIALKAQKREYYWIRTRSFDFLNLYIYEVSFNCIEKNQNSFLINATTDAYKTIQSL